MADLEDEIGDIIAKARLGLGLTLDQLARTTGLSSRLIEKVERYQPKPDWEQVQALAEALSLDPNKLRDIALGNWSPKLAMLARNSAILESIFVPYGAYGENCYIIACRGTSMAGVVDPGGAADEIQNRLAELNLMLDLVMITHAHGDHIGGLRALESAYPTVRLAANPLEWSSIPQASVRWEAAEDKVQVRLGNLDIVALHTPGHTPGSTCYSVDGVCFVGDTLFAGSIGRPTGPEAYQRMLADIRQKVLSLPDDTILLPGHGPATTVGEERSHNPFF